MRLSRLSFGPPGRCLWTCSFLLAGILLLGCASNSASEEGAEAVSDTAPPSESVEAEPAPNPEAPTDIETQADDRSVAEKIEDAGLETKAKRTLVKTSALRVFPFRLTVINGRLILRGDVNTADQYAMAERVVRQVEGIQEVINRLTMGGRAVTAERLASEEANGEETGAVYHTVKAGDTLWDIARQYRSSVQQIRDLNDFRSTNLRPGERIRVR